MTMFDRIREEEEKAERLRKELRIEEIRIEEKKARGEKLNSRRWYDLSRAIRRCEREIRLAKKYLADAERRTE